MTETVPENRRMEVLLVEDSAIDAKLVREAFREARFDATLWYAVDGVEALEFLRRQGRFADAPRPDLVLLDLNLPRMDGREFIVELKNDPGLRDIRIVVLTTSTAHEDVSLCYAAGADAFVSKPMDLVDFAKALKIAAHLRASNVDEGEGS